MANPGPNIETSAMNLGAIAPGTGRILLPFYVALVQVINNTDLMTDFPLTFKGRIMGVDWVTHTKVATAGKAATLTTKIRKGTTTTVVTGGVLALTSALGTPEGALLAGTAITALNSFNRGDFLTLSWTAVTAFAEGTGHVMVTLINDDTQDALARQGLLFNP